MEKRGFVITSDKIIYYKDSNKYHHIDLEEIIKDKYMDYLRDLGFDEKAITPFSVIKILPQAGGIAVHNVSDQDYILMFLPDINYISDFQRVNLLNFLKNENDRIVINCDFNSDSNIRDKSYLINVLKSKGKNK